MAVNANAERLWIALIGVVGYHPQIGRVPYAGEDCRLLLQRFADGALPLPPDQVLRLSDHETEDPALHPTRDNLSTRLKEWLTKPGSGDTVVVFFAGHGMVFDGRCVLLPMDAEPGREQEKGLPLADLRHSLANSAARQKFLLLDACHTGEGTRDVLAGRPANDGVADAIQRELACGSGFYAISACGQEEVAVDDHRLKNGLFSHFLGRALAGECPAEDSGAVHVEEVYKFVHRHVSNTALQTHQIRQNPTRHYHGTGEAILFRRRPASDVSGRRHDATEVTKRARQLMAAGELEQALALIEADTPAASGKRDDNFEINAVRMEIRAAIHRRRAIRLQEAEERKRRQVDALLEEFRREVAAGRHQAAKAPLEAACELDAERVRPMLKSFERQLAVRCLPELKQLGALLEEAERVENESPEAALVLFRELRRRPYPDDDVPERVNLGVARCLDAMRLARLRRQLRAALDRAGAECSTHAEQVKALESLHADYQNLTMRRLAQKTGDELERCRAAESRADRGKCWLEEVVKLAHGVTDTKSLAARFVRSPARLEVAVDIWLRNICLPEEPLKLLAPRHAVAVRAVRKWSVQAREAFDAATARLQAAKASRDGILTRNQGIEAKNKERLRDHDLARQEADRRYLEDRRKKMGTDRQVIPRPTLELPLPVPPEPELTVDFPPAPVEALRRLGRRAREFIPSDLLPALLAGNARLERLLRTE